MSRVRSLCALVLFMLAAFASASADQDQYLHARMQSALLTQFWGQPVSIDAYVLLPDSYYKEPQRRYPIMYWVQGFGGNGSLDYAGEAQFQHAMRHLHREFIIVLLDGMFNGGHQEFVDSANNGPWGSALTTEFIPQTEAHFRAIGTADARFVAGHSSGGWCALLLQIAYPDLFRAEWSLSPDPVDFRDFTGPDLTKLPPQNFYTDAFGHDYWLDGQRLRDFVVGPGWEKSQFESFDAVFSPRGADGKPEPLFDRRTGAIDAAVEQYWETHFDIATILRSRWTTLGLKLHGKIHIIVGTHDQFGLQEPVALLEAELRSRGSDAEIDFVPGANHFTVFDYKGSAIGYIFGEASALLSP